MDSGDFNKRFRGMAKKENSASGGLRNRAFARFFANYDERVTTDANGRTRVERVYCGDWYVPDMSDKLRVLQRTALTMLYLLTFFVFSLCASMNIGVNRVKYIAMIQGVDVIVLILYAIALAYTLGGKKRLMAESYKSGPLLVRKLSLVCSALLVLTAVITVSYALFRQEDVGKHLLCAGGYVIGALLSFVSHRLESGVTYTKIPSEEKDV